MSFSPIRSNRTPELPDAEAAHFQDEPPTLSLPNDVIGQISSFATRQEARTLSLVSRSISIVTVGQRYTDIFNDLRSFIHQLRLKLVDESKKETLTRIESALKEDLDTMFNSIDPYIIGDALPKNRLNLIDLKKYIFLVKQEIIRVLNTLSEEETEALQEIPLPSFFENIWEARKLYAQLEMETRNPQPANKHQIRLAEISANFAKAGEVDKAFEVANSITSYQWRQSAFNKISRALVERGSFNRVFEAATLASEAEALASIHNGYSWVLWIDLAQILAEKGEFDLAMQAADKLQHNSVNYGAALLHISQSYAKKGNFEAATKIASIIPIDEGYYEQNNALIFLGICKSLATSGKEDLVAQIIKLINFPIEGRIICIKVIISLLLENEESDKAIEMVSNLKFSDLMYQDLLESLIKELIKREKFDEALKMVNNLDWEYSRNGHLQNIVKGLWKDEKHDHARKAFNMITTPQMRNPLLEEIPELQENQQT